RVVSISPRPNATADDDLGAGILEFVSNPLQQPDCLEIGVDQTLAAVAQSRGPVRVGPPGRGLEDQAGTELFGQGGIGPEVLAKSRLAIGPFEQVEGGKVGKLQPLEKDQGGLDATVGKEQIALELGQSVAISSHVAPRAGLGSVQPGPGSITRNK